MWSRYGDSKQGQQETMKKEQQVLVYQTTACFKGATKLYFTHYSCGVIILYNTGLEKSAFSPYSFGKLVFRLFVFSAYTVFLFYLRKLYKIYIIIVFINVSYSVILFSPYKKQFVKTNTYTSWKFDSSS